MSSRPNISFRITVEEVFGVFSVAKPSLLSEVKKGLNCLQYASNSVPIDSTHSQTAVSAI
jgi:hypothetical protein